MAWSNNAGRASRIHAVARGHRAIFKSPHNPGRPLQVRTLIEPTPGQLQHPDTRIEAAHEGATVTQRREQGPGAAAGVEDPPTGHVPGEGQHRGTLVAGHACLRGVWACSPGA